MSEFIKDMLIRALKTVCQTAVAILTLGAVWSEIDIIYVVSASSLAGVISLLMTLANIPLKGGE